MGIWTNTPGLMVELKELWDADELTSKEIAKKLNEKFGISVTENAVIGTANRQKMMDKPGYKSHRNRVPRPHARGIEADAEQPEEKRGPGGHTIKKPTLAPIPLDRYKGTVLFKRP